MNERLRKATRLTLSLDEKDYRTLNEIALAREASGSWFIRQAIRQFLDAMAKPGKATLGAAQALKPDDEP